MILSGALVLCAAKTNFQCGSFLAIWLPSRPTCGLTDVGSSNGITIDSQGDRREIPSGFSVERDPVFLQEICGNLGCFLCYDSKIEQRRAFHRQSVTIFFNLPNAQIF